MQMHVLLQYHAYTCTWKLSLDKNFAKPNYLYIAEKVGRKIFTNVKVTIS